MAKILITSGPTREYLDPVRFLSNGSSGKFGCAIAEAAIAFGHEVVVVSGPVQVAYPPQAVVVPVVSTEEMLAESLRHFARCDGAIGVAAPCDYRPRRQEIKKIRKSGEGLVLVLDETPDVIGALGQQKTPSQWTLAFALETDAAVARAREKLRVKRADAIVLNGPESIDADEVALRWMTPDDTSVPFRGPKSQAALWLIERVQQLLIRPEASRSLPGGHG